MEDVIAVVGGFAPPAVTVLVGAAIVFRRRRHPALPLVGWLLVAVGLADVAVQSLREPGVPLLPAELVGAAGVTGGAVAAIRLAAALTERRVVPRWATRGALLVGGVLAGLSLIEPFHARPRWQLVVGLVALLSPLIGSLVATVARLGRPRDHRGHVAIRHALLSGSLLLLALVMVVRAVAVVTGSESLHLATQVVNPFLLLALLGGAAPPRWLRATLVQRDLDAAGHGFLLDWTEPELADGALARAVVVTGADGGVMLDARGDVIATAGLDGDEHVAAVVAAVRRPCHHAPSRRSARPPLSLTFPMGTGSGRFLLVAGPLVPVLGVEEIDQVRELGALVAVALERIEAREQLARSERSLRDAQVLARMGNFTYDVAAGEASWGPGMAHILGLRGGGVTRTVRGDLPQLHEDDRERGLEQARRVIETGRGWRDTYRIVRPGGEVRWVDTRVRAVKNDDGTVERLEGVAVDITELHRLAEDRLAQEELFRHLYLQLERAREDERRRIALELHDDLGQLLTGLQLRVAAVDVAAGSGLEQVSALIAELQQRVRDLALDLRPGLLDRLGLAAALRWYAGHVAETLGLQVSLDLGIVDGQRFDPDVETHAFRIVQEALSNVHRHADTTSASVSVSLNDEWLLVQVNDRGQGFVAGPRRQTTGLSGMQERASSVGGSCLVVTGAGEGTQVLARLPARDVTHDLGSLGEAGDSDRMAPDRGIADEVTGRTRRPAQDRAT